MLQIDLEKCNACSLCEQSCPFNAIKLQEGRPEVDAGCTLCGSCTSICPAGALTIQRPHAPAEELAGYRGVLVVAECETCNGIVRPQPVVWELLAKGRELAYKLNQELLVAALGDDRLENLESLCHYGADRVLRCAHPLLKEFSPDGFCTVLATLITRVRPSIVLYGATPNGRELAPRVAARLRLGLTADCTGLDIDEQGQLVQTRPAFGGNIMAAIIAPRSRPQTATVRPNVFAANFYDPTRPVHVEDQPVHLKKAAIRTKVVQEIHLPEADTVHIDACRVLVSAGRGCRTPAELDKVRQLAQILGGAVACSRPLVEEGLFPHTRQVGQSGTTVGPDLYIAVGISGAVQHMVGMNTAKKIIAINKDPDAPIFRIADLGIVGEAGPIIESLLTQLKGRQSSSPPDAQAALKSAYRIS